MIASRRTLNVNRVIAASILAALIAADLGSPNLLFAQRTGRPTMPRVLHGYCEGEDQCAHIMGAHLLACEPLVLRADARRNAPVVKKVAQGDSLQVTDATTRVVAPGIVVARRSIVVADEWADDQGRVPRRDTVRMTVGDTLYVLEYGELGTWAWWYRGRLWSGGEFWSGPAQRVFDRTYRPPAVSLSAPRAELWVQVTTPAGAKGWWQWRDQSVASDSACRDLHSSRNIRS